MKRFLCLVVILSFSIPSFAQQSVSSDSPATKEDVERLFTTLHLRDQIQRMMDLSTKQSKQMAVDALKKKLPDISQKDLDQINAMIDHVLKDMDVNGMLDDMVPVYQRHLTTSDVAAMESFYEEDAQGTTRDDGGGHESGPTSDGKDDDRNHGRSGKGRQRSASGVQSVQGRCEKQVSAQTCGRIDAALKRAEQKTDSPQK